MVIAAAAVCPPARREQRQSLTPTSKHPQHSLCPHHLAHSLTPALGCSLSPALAHSPVLGHSLTRAHQVIKEYTSKVDLLMSERKEAKEAVEAHHEAVKQQQASINAYATLMPLALPAPGQPGVDPNAGGGFGGPAAGTFTGGGYGGAGY